MAASHEFQQLDGNIKRLRRSLLPKSFNILGTYQQRSLDRALAFRVLSHAEFEHYLEERARTIAMTAVERWRNSKEIGTVLLCLVAFTESHEKIPDTLAPDQENRAQKWQERLRLDARVNRAHSQYIGRLKKNHGIKEINVLQILLPIGLSSASLDPLWVAEMNSFGESRGSAAHTSIVNHMINPRDELQTVTHLLQGLRDLDQKLEELN